MSRRLHALALLCGALTLGCGAADLDTLEAAADDLEVSTHEAALRTNKEPDRLVVYSNNVENLIFDWKDLVHYMAEEPLRPDLFLVQQMSDREGMDRLTGFMSRRLGVKYEGVVAQAKPTDTRFQGQVLPKPPVTTGIVFRSARFDLVSKDTWFPWGKGFKNQPQTCGARSDRSGYETIRVKLFDKIAKKHVIVVSLRHWTWHPCSTKNIFEIAEGEDSGPNAHPGLGAHAALHIVGGDFNDRAVDPDGGYACWYREMNRHVGGDSCSGKSTPGFTDPLFESCDGKKSCVRERGGIDYIFARRPDGVKVRTAGFDIVSAEAAHRASVRSTGGDGRSNIKSRDGFNDAGPMYSQHRARRAYVFYE